MTIKELIESHVFETINIGDDTERTISGLFCCDLLSIAMSKAPADSVWVTVMGNINTLGRCRSVCGRLYHSRRRQFSLDEAARTKALQQHISVLRTEQPIFDAALSVYEKLHA